METSAVDIYASSIIAGIIAKEGRKSILFSLNEDIFESEIKEIYCFAEKIVDFKNKNAKIKEKQIIPTGKGWIPYAGNNFIYELFDLLWDDGKITTGFTKADVPPDGSGCWFRIIAYRKHEPLINMEK